MSAPDGRGTVTQVADGVRVEFTRRWARPVDDVWAALTEDELLTRWIGSYDGERHSGGRGTFTMTHEDEPSASPLLVRECAAPRRLVVEWVQEDEQGWRVELDLAPDGAGSVLTFGQLFPPGTDGTDYALGWHWYLDKLDAVLTGGPAPADWATFEAAARPGYA